MTDKLTDQQRACLDVLSHAVALKPSTLAAALGTSPEGAAKTASSLVRRGLASRVVVRAGRRQTVGYIRTKVLA